MTTDEIRALVMDLLAIAVELVRQLDTVAAERDAAVAQLAGALDCQIGSRATITTLAADNIHDAVAQWEEEHETCEH